MRPETKDRVDQEALKRLLAKPLKAAEAGDIPLAQNEFEVVLGSVEARRGPSSLEAADTVSAFGVELFNLGRKTEARPYLKRAVDAYRLAVGPDDPELALALHDYVNLELAIDSDAASPELVDAIREALRIRRLALGLDNQETAVTYVLLGRVSGNPKLTGGSDARIDEAAELIQRGAELLQGLPGRKPEDLTWAHFRLAELDAYNGLGREAIAATAVYWGSVDQQDPLEVIFWKLKILDLADALSAHGQADAATSLRKAYPIDPKL